VPDALYCKLSCTINAAVRPEYFCLIDQGPAVAQLVDAFVARAPIDAASPLWQLQPRELWGEEHFISEEDAAKLNAVEG
jgi:hypothetical protein